MWGGQISIHKVVSTVLRAILAIAWAVSLERLEMCYMVRLAFLDLECLR